MACYILRKRPLRGCILMLSFVENHPALILASHLRLPIFFCLALHGLTALF